MQGTLKEVKRCAWCNRRIEGPYMTSPADSIFCLNHGMACNEKDHELAGVPGTSYWTALEQSKERHPAKPSIPPDERVPDSSDTVLVRLEQFPGNAQLATISDFGEQLDFWELRGYQRIVVEDDQDQV